MLSGIKTGKRKRPATGGSAAQHPSSIVPRGPVGSAAPAIGSSSISGGAGGAGGSNNNSSAAEALRMSLLGGGSSSSNYNKHNNADNEKSDIQSRLDARASSYKNNESAIHSLQSRGRISNNAISTPQNNNDTIVIHSKRKSKSTIPNENSYNSRGKLSRHAHDQLRQTTEQEISIEEMAAQERNSTSNMDDDFARNMMRMGKGFNKLEKAMGTNSRSGADEEDYLQETSSISNLYRSNDDKMAPAQLAARSKSRQIAQHDALSKWTSKSWWWMESPKFDKRYLIALGEKVSLVMTPTHKRLQQHNAKAGKWDGGQCYIVPLPYSESFVGLDEEVWYEVRRFQSCLRQMFRREGRGVIFQETVTRTSSGGGGTALQAKMEVIPVPLSVERDAPLYFKSALAEVAQEWGTHGLKPVVLDGQKKTLRNAVPKRGFPYFYCGWGDCGGEGFVQLIENEDDEDDGEDGGGYGGGGGMRGGGGSKRFPRDFGLDTIGGMMDCDPMRFQRKTPSRDGDRGEILQFCDKWKEFDWTLELDG